MGTGNTFKTDLFELNNYVQNSMISYPKEIIIETLREYFSQDSYYKYQRDEWGFPKTPNHNDLPQDAGLNDNLTTRLFIGEPYRQNIVYYPCILIKSGGSRSVPISFNRERGSVQWRPTRIIDGYGNESIYNIPVSFIYAGAWEGSINIDVKTKSLSDRDELIDIISLMLVDTKFDDLKNAGVLIKTVSAGSPSETDDINDKLYYQTISIDIRSEWYRLIPVENTIDMINFCVDFGQIINDEQVVAPNISISTTLDLLDNLNNI